jgi:hypothetical protein
MTFPAPRPLRALGAAAGACLVSAALIAGCNDSSVVEPGAPRCGGLAATPCPGAGECVDDTADDCDPAAGGADCGGACECNALGSCSIGFEWDDAPEVCDCVRSACEEDYHPCIAATCPVGSACVPVGCDATCVPLEEIPCGDVTCEVGMVCCNPSCGICTPPEGACVQIACDDE